MTAGDRSLVDEASCGWKETVISYGVRFWFLWTTASCRKGVAGTVCVQGGRGRLGSVISYPLEQRANQDTTVS